MYRNADLETILATDLNQLGQVPKLQTLAMAALRTRLLADLDALLSTFSKVDGGKSKAKVDAEVSPRSCILDGSPKSLRPTEFGCDPEMQHVALPCLSTPPAVRTPEITAAISPLMADSMVRFLAAITLAVRHAWLLVWTEGMDSWRLSYGLHLLNCYMIAYGLLSMPAVMAPRLMHVCSTCVSGVLRTGRADSSLR
jgi:hypothetical protein